LHEKKSALHSRRRRRKRNTLGGRLSIETMVEKKSDLRLLLARGGRQLVNIARNPDQTKWDNNDSGETLGVKIGLPALGGKIDPLSAGEKETIHRFGL